MSEQICQRLGVVEPAKAHRVVEAAPAAAVRRLQAQVDWRRDRLRCEDGVGELEEGVSAAMELVVKGASEDAQGVESKGVNSVSILPRRALSGHSRSPHT